MELNGTKWEYGTFHNTTILKSFIEQESVWIYLHEQKP